MRQKLLYIMFLLVAAYGPVSLGDQDAEVDKVEILAGQDLQLNSTSLVSHRLSSGEHILVFGDGLSMSIGANQFSSGKAVVWVYNMAEEFVDRGRGGYIAIAYLAEGISVQKAATALATDLHKVATRDGLGMVVWFPVSGEVLVSADNREVSDPHGSELYTKAVIALRDSGMGERIVQAANLPVPKPPEKGKRDPRRPGEPVEPGFRYPVNISPAGDTPAVFESAKMPDKTEVLTVIGRFYIWQKQDELGGLIELQADYAVVFFSADATDPNNKEELNAQALLASGKVKGIYLSGDVLMTEGPRTIRGEELYYDFELNKAIIENAEMRNFNPDQGVPIYIRAKELRQVAQDKFVADDVTVTTSEFYKPQLSLDVKHMDITDTTPTDALRGGVTKSSFDAEMRDVDLKVYDTKIFHLDRMRSNFERPDIPLKSAHFGNSSRWGTMLETRWYLAKILGLQEPEGTDSTLALDYYSKRGVGAGAEVEYVRENYFGKVIGYVINDHGEDRLGRHATRKNLDPERDWRSRFRWQHRQFLEHNWQLTGEISYLSDMNFLESYYRGEFDVGKEQETLLHLKRIEDNWGLSFLSKMRINDFVSQLEELPTAEFHLTGQSFFNDRLTFYSDTQVSQFRQRYAPSSALPLMTTRGSEQFFTFATTRNEVDMPLSFGKTKLVPFVAGTVAYEDGMGFFREIDGSAGSREDKVYYGETGVRISRQPFWKVYPGVKSRLLDVDQLRHLIRPHMTAVSYHENESVIEQRDIVNLGLSQRLQTKRGKGEMRRTVDWMRLNTDVTFVNNDGSASSGADRFMWNKPFIPMANTYGGLVTQTGGILAPQDRRSSVMSGVRRDYVGADYSWRISDTTAFLSDMNYDLQSGVVQQFNVGFSRMRWPDLSYYVGSRYLRRITILDPTTGMKLQEGSTAFVFAITYVLDPRYTVVFSQQIDFDYGATVGSELSLLRHYHRMFWGLTYRTDESLDEHAIVFSIWPQGVSDAGIGSRRYMGLGDSAGGY